MATVERHDTREVGTRPLPEGQALQRFEGERSAEFVAGGTMAEAVAGIAAVVLAIVGLAGVVPGYLAAIAAIVLSAAFLLRASGMVAGFSGLLAETAGIRWSNRPFAGGMRAESFGGAAGIVLGILSLLGMVPAILLSVTAIVFGAILLLVAVASARMHALILDRVWAGPEHELSRHLLSAMGSGTGGAHVLVGLAAAVLGIVGLVGIVPITLVLVAFVCLGAWVDISCSTAGGRMTTACQQ